MKRILVTGGNGFIGSHLVDELTKNYEVYILDNHFPSFGKNYNPKANIINGDIQNFDHVDFATTNIHTVIHLAALSHVTNCHKNPLMAVNVNVLGTANVLEACRKNDVSRVIIAGTDHIYGHQVSENSKVSELYHNNGIINGDTYAVTKTMTVALTNLYHREYGLSTVITLSGNVFSERQSKPNVIPSFIESALQDKNIIIHGDGEQTREFYHIDNLVYGYKLCIETPNIEGETFNFSGNNEVTINDLAQKIIDIIGSKSRIEHDLSTSSGMNAMSLDISKAERILGYKVITSFDEGLKRTIRGYDNGL